MGGVGKTELALRLADGWKADYPDAQLMIDLHGYDQDFVTTERALEMVIHAFHPEVGQLPATVAELQSVYQSVWQVQVKAGKRMMLYQSTLARKGK